MRKRINNKQLRAQAGRSESESRTRPATERPEGDDAATSLLDKAIGTLHMGLSAIETELELIIDDKGPESKHDKGSRIAFLTHKIGAIADSLRKVEAARARRIAGLNPALVMAYVRSLDVTDREALVREILTIGAKRNGLG